MRDRLSLTDAAAFLADATDLAVTAFPHASPLGNMHADPCDPVGLARAQQHARQHIREAVADGCLTIPTAARLAAAHAALIERVALLDEDAPPLHQLLALHRHLLARAHRRWWSALFVSRFPPPENPS